MNTTDVIVIGGGLMGLTSAYFLQKEGLSVTIIDKSNDVATGASYANGGLLTPSMPEPWNSPGVHKSLLKYMFDSTAPLLLNPRYLHKYLVWGLKFLRASGQQQHRQATDNNVNLALISLNKLEEICGDLKPSFNRNTRGTLKIFRTEAGLKRAEASAKHLEQYGLKSRVLTRTGLTDLEPALSEVANSLEGAIYYPDDQTGDARQFSLLLKSYLERVGVRFCFNTKVLKLDVKNKATEGVFTSDGYVAAKRVVVSAGAWTKTLLSPFKISFPVEPVKGYSVTIAQNKDLLNPKIAVLDDDLHSAVTPFEEHLRLAGTAEFSSWNSEINPKRISNLLQFYKSVFPSLYENTDFTTQKVWCGHRPMSADGNPFIGKVDDVKGLFINAGHGPLGWTQCAASGYLISSQVVGRESNFDTSNYRLNR